MGFFPGSRSGMIPKALINRPIETLHAEKSVANAFLGSQKIPVESTALFVKPALSDFTQEAIGFFTSIRIPAALIAGSSLGALFVMIQRANRPDQENSRRNLIAVFFYHALSLLSLLLSLNVIVTATSASNTMLIATCNPLAESAYNVLIGEMKFEYLTTRWSFYASLICFLKAVLLRTLLEFDLLRRKRLRPALVVVFSVTTFVAHILHVSCIDVLPSPMDSSII